MLVPRQVVANSRSLSRSSDATRSATRWSQTSPAGPGFRVPKQSAVADGQDAISGHVQNNEAAEFRRGQCERIELDATHWCRPSPTGAREPYAVSPINACSSVNWITFRARNSSAAQSPVRTRLQARPAPTTFTLRSYPAAILEFWMSCQPPLLLTPPVPLTVMAWSVPAIPAAIHQSG
jgi:hypothetical protein